MSQPATERAGEGPLAASIGDFDHHADTYREDVENAISWSGKDVDYFAEGKAKLLLRWPSDASATRRSCARSTWAAASASPTAS
jgi:hypothetical protein